jgi:hypothetical protein
MIKKISVMKKLNLWMLAAILTFCGTTTMLTSCSENDEPVAPEQQGERTRFESQLSTTLSNSVEYQNLQTTLRAAEVLTGFIEQLNIDALSPQLNDIMTNVLVNTKPKNIADLGEYQAEAREALKNTFSELADAPMFSLTTAEKALNNMRMTYVEGESAMKYEKGVGDGLVIAYQKPSTKEVTELTFKFKDVNDGVIMFVRKLNGIPMAIEFPATISFTMSRSLDGVSSELVDGIVTLKAPNGRKYISLKGCEWDLGVAATAGANNRYEVPMAFMHHYADGRVDGQVGLSINGTTVLDLAINSTGIPYDDTEMEQLKSMREMGIIYAGFYEVLRLFNSRSGKAQLTVMEDLVFNADVKDVAQAVTAMGSALQQCYREHDKADLDPLLEQLNKAVSFTVEQKSTGITAEGKIVTANIEGIYQPALALRFSGESDFTMVYDNMSEADRANYRSLVKSFDAPIQQLYKMFNVLNQKRQDIKNLNLFKGL